MTILRTLGCVVVWLLKLEFLPHDVSIHAVFSFLANTAGLTPNAVDAIKANYTHSPHGRPVNHICIEVYVIYKYLFPRLV